MNAWMLLACLAGAISSATAQPILTYTLTADSADLSGVRIELRVRNAPASFHLAMAKHPEYDDRFWRYVDDLRVDPAGAVARVQDGLWQISGGAKEAVIRYRIRLDKAGNSQAAWRPFLAPTGGLVGDLHMFPYVVESPQAPAHVILNLPAEWKVATALAPTADPHTFFAANAAELNESPILVGKLREWRFVVEDTPFRVAYWALPDAKSFDETAFVAGLEKLVRASTTVFSGFPWREYTFLFRDGAFGALEHPDCLTLGLPSTQLASNPNALLESVAHEFFHAWNLMRIRPAEDKGGPTGLWFSEGMSMFYADLLLRRAGLPVRTASRIAHLEELIARYLESPGNSRFSAEQVSRVAFNPQPGGLGDYSASTHLQGELLGAMLDFTIRDATEGKQSIDDLMRAMFASFPGPRGFTSHDVEQLAEGLCHCDLAGFFDRYVRRAGAIDFGAYLRLAGLEMEVTRESVPDLRVYPWMPEGESVARLQISDPGSVWGRAGLHTGDRIVGFTAADFRRKVNSLRVGDSVSLEVRHDGVTREVSVLVGTYERPVCHIRKIKEPSARQASLFDGWANYSSESPGR